MEKLLTFSVAAYQVEHTIDQLMQSIIDSGEMERVEVFIVDDGSKDRTGEIAKGYQSRYPESVYLISKQNGGHGSTINSGIAEASGKYFRAIDGDDWVNSGNMKALLEVLEQTNADMILCDYEKCFSNGKNTTVRFQNLQENTVLPIGEALKKTKWICYQTVIYRTQILKSHEIHLTENCFYEDNEYCLFPIPYIRTVYYFPYPVYCYRLGTDGQSVSAESRMKNIGHGRTIAESLLAFCDGLPTDLGIEAQDYIVRETARHCYWYIRSLLLFPASKDKMVAIKNFDKEIQIRNPKVYQAMANFGIESWVIRSFRFSGFQSYWWMHGFIRLYKTLKRYMKK